jgi:hypothetical protein
MSYSSRRRRRNNSFSSVARLMRKKEEERRMIEERKNCPVVYCDFDWQIDRCLKAMSMQPFVQELIPIIEEARQGIIEVEERKCDEKLFDLGNSYEVSKSKVLTDIAKLKELGVSVSGRQYGLNSLSSSKIITKPERVIEYFGNTFTVNDSQPIELDDDILSSKNYFETRYKEMDPKELEKIHKKINKKANRIQKFGKAFNFLLETDMAIELESEREKINNKYDKCVIMKKEMESFNSLNKDQLLAIKSYLISLKELMNISSEIKSLFFEKEIIHCDYCEYIYNLAIIEVMNNSNNRELLVQIYYYINNIRSNDEKTMKEAYELVKGEYPISLPKKYFYNLLFNNLKDYYKEKPKTLKLG